jgi:hypothetical protein
VLTVMIAGGLVFSTSAQPMTMTVEASRLGDPDKRPPRYDYAWHALEPDGVGIDDYMNLDNLLD